MCSARSMACFGLCINAQLCFKVRSGALYVANRMVPSFHTAALGMHANNAFFPVHVHAVKHIAVLMLCLLIGAACCDVPATGHSV